MYAHAKAHNHPAQQQSSVGVDEQDHTAAGNQEVAEQDGLPAALVN